MTNILKSFILSVTVICIVSCNTSQKKPLKTEHEKYRDKKQIYDSLNDVESYRLSNNTHAIVGWDTLKQFTYSLQELLDGKSQSISFIGIIRDIIKIDSTYILKVVNTNRKVARNYIAEISISAIDFHSLNQKLDPNPHEINEGCFIIQVDKVSLHYPILSSGVESNGDNVEDATSYLTLNYSEKMIELKGNLIAYYLYKNIHR